MPLTAREHSRLYTARLSAYSTKINLKALKSAGKITLANLLSGDTCDPISLAEFEVYLAYKEHSIENIQFLSWYQNYRTRFFELPEEQQARSPGPKGFKFSLPSPASTERRAAEAQYMYPDPPSPTSSRLPASQFSPTRSTSDALLMSSSSAPTSSPTRSLFESTPTSPVRSQYEPRQSMQSQWTAVASPEAAFSAPRASYALRASYAPTYISSFTMPVVNPTENQPFRKECLRVLATFINPGAPKELPLDQVVRDTLIKNATHNTHPDTFLPAYEEMYNLLEQDALPRFLAASTANINWSKQLFWYIIGTIDFLIGVAIAVSMILYKPTTLEANRAWRLWCLPFILFGSMQIYAATRGFCAQVFGRASLQLHVWELQEGDAEKQAHWNADLDPSRKMDTWAKSGPSFTLEKDKTIRMPDLRLDRKGAFDIAPFAEFGDDNDGEGGAPSVTLSTAPLHKDPSNNLLSRNGYMRPPIFGPEKLVLDPRIKAVHQQVMNDIYKFGVGATVVFLAIILSIPDRR